VGGAEPWSNLPLSELERIVLVRSNQALQTLRGATVLAKRRLGRHAVELHVTFAVAMERELVLTSLDGRTIYCSGWANGSYIPATAWRLPNYSPSSVITLNQIY